MIGRNGKQRFDKARWLAETVKSVSINVRSSSVRMCKFSVCMERFALQFDWPKRYETLETLSKRKRYTTILKRTPNA